MWMFFAMMPLLWKKFPAMIKYFYLRALVFLLNQEYRLPQFAGIGKVFRDNRGCDVVREIAREHARTPLRPVDFQRVSFDQLKAGIFRPPLPHVRNKFPVHFDGHHMA